MFRLSWADRTRWCLWACWGCPNNVASVTPFLTELAAQIGRPGILEQCGRRGGAADLVTLLGIARGSEGRKVAYTGFRHPCIIVYTGMGRFGFVRGRAWVGHCVQTNGRFLFVFGKRGNTKVFPN